MSCGWRHRLPPGPALRAGTANKDDGTQRHTQSVARSPSLIRLAPRDNG